MADIPSKLRIGILFGGRSAEHDVSVLSASNVLKALAPEKYEAVPIFVTRDGRWLLSSFEDGVLARLSSGTELCLVPGGRGRVVTLAQDGTPYEFVKLDIIFPVLHGLHGEDGAVQGLAEVARIPLAGCGIIGSANALDKDIAKRLFNQARVPAARSVTIYQENIPSLSDLKEKLGLPIFIKPARQGSSVGVSKVSMETDYGEALAAGFLHDSKLLAEEFIQGREIECAVLEDENGNLFVSRTGEIVPAERHGFYTYDAKYIDQEGAALRIPADLPEKVEEEIRSMARIAFKALGCDGMARVDFFVTADMRILINELNTIPGFTDISMYSKVMNASGVSYPEIIDRLVLHGLARAERTV
ncbi:D-alanine--D-alanine ligase [Agrobacterium salinitolerans]|uniref:D-alanine--D-alanine ligase family protein n=1 Tax=Agrobacterium salinitolerans TaxID=1183413 RepID=UPI001C2343DB|nr:D-alanine--D-alanine ligase family protein [Agrobacterium salinitolerans]QXC48593.1 D-alanine--D-alanine ligase [Agrobacterium salinitolerans]